MHNISRRGLMFVLSSPSGAGKTTLTQMLLEAEEHLHPSISYTTRAPRNGEIDGVHYFFTNENEFQNMITQDVFLEYAQVFNNMYGTPKALVENYLSNGEDVIFDIDWQGHRSFKQISPDDVVSVFLLPPSKKELRERLVKRAQNNLETIDFRMQKANSELQHWQEYDYVIVNKDLNSSLNKLRYILHAERLRKNRRLGLPKFVEQLLQESEC